MLFLIIAHSLSLVYLRYKKLTKQAFCSSANFYTPTVNFIVMSCALAEHVCCTFTSAFILLFVHPNCRKFIAKCVFFSSAKLVNDFVYNFHLRGGFNVQAHDVEMQLCFFLENILFL